MDRARSAALAHDGLDLPQARARPMREGCVVLICGKRPPRKHLDTGCMTTAWIIFGLLSWGSVQVLVLALFGLVRDPARDGPRVDGASDAGMANAPAHAH